MAPVSHKETTETFTINDVTVQIFVYERKQQLVDVNRNGGALINKQCVFCRVYSFVLKRRTNVSYKALAELASD